jgi:hypothetical protein
MSNRYTDKCTVILGRWWNLKIWQASHDLEIEGVRLRPGDILVSVKGKVGVACVVLDYAPYTNGQSGLP